MTDLIDDYTATLRTALAGQRDVEQLVLEMEDHLRETAEALVRQGKAEVLAQELAIMRLGDPRMVSAALVAARARTLAVPTRATVLLGRVAVLASIVWAGAALLQLVPNPAALSGVDSWVTGSSVVVTFLGVVALAPVIVALAIRSGHVRDARALGIVWLLLLLLLAQATLPWVLPVTATLILPLAISLAMPSTSTFSRAIRTGAATTLLAGCLFVVASMVEGKPNATAAALALITAVVTALGAASSLAQGPAGAGPAVLAVAWPIGMALLFTMQALRVGPAGYYEDYPLAFTVGLLASFLLTAVGSALIGRRLSAETAPVLPSRRTGATIST